ncbi:hypothetical protein AB834_05080 [PVC group bacterium (ex Bugula neritina AB1)]|nr:hypothetical protein AB834_05080 [PVC group bacterium (ex Bugula neritina AB1)]
MKKNIFFILIQIFLINQYLDFSWGLATQSFSYRGKEVVDTSSDSPIHNVENPFPNLDGSIEATSLNEGERVPLSESSWKWNKFLFISIFHIPIICVILSTVMFFGKIFVIKENSVIATFVFFSLGLIIFLGLLLVNFRNKTWIFKRNKSEYGGKNHNLFCAFFLLYTGIILIIASFFLALFLIRPEMFYLLKDSSCAWLFSMCWVLFALELAVPAIHIIRSSFKEGKVSQNELDEAGFADDDASYVHTSNEFNSDIPSEYVERKIENNESNSLFTSMGIDNADEEPSDSESFKAFEEDLWAGVKEANDDSLLSYIELQKEHFESQIVILSKLQETLMKEKDSDKKVKIQNLNIYKKATKKNINLINRYIIETEDLISRLKEKNINLIEYERLRKKVFTRSQSLIGQLNRHLSDLICCIIDKPIGKFGLETPVVSEKLQGLFQGLNQTLKDDFDKDRDSYFTKKSNYKLDLIKIEIPRFNENLAKLKEEVRGGSPNILEEVRGGSSNILEEVRGGSSNILEEVRGGSSNILEEVLTFQMLLLENKFMCDLFQDLWPDNESASRGESSIVNTLRALTSLSVGMKLEIEDQARRKSA